MSMQPVTNKSKRRREDEAVGIAPMKVVRRKVGYDREDLRRACKSMSSMSIDKS